MDFGFNLYFVFNEIVKTPVEVFYHKLDNKLFIFEDIVEKTITLYKKNYHDKIALYEADYIKLRAKAVVVYNDVMAEEGDNDTNHLLAMHKSGLDEIEHYHDRNKEELKLVIDDMEDNFNKSSLIGIYSILESETKKLCKILKVEFSVRLPYELLESKDYFNTSLNYFDYVLDLKVTDLLPLQTKFINLQYLRNRLIHGGGEFEETTDQLNGIIIGSNGQLALQDDNGEEINLEQEIVDNKKLQVEKPKKKGEKNIVETSENDFAIVDKRPRFLRIKDKNFIIEYCNLLRLFFEKVFWLVDEKDNFKILRSRLNFLIRYVEKNYEIKNLKISDVKGGKLIKCEAISLTPQTLMNIGLNIYATANISNVLLIENRIENNEDLDRLIVNLESNDSLIFRDVLHGFNLSGHPLKVKLIFY
jgi:hypothetical protein